MTHFLSFIRVRTSHVSTNTEGTQQHRYTICCACGSATRHCLPQSACRHFKAYLGGTTDEPQSLPQRNAANLQATAYPDARPLIGKMLAWQNVGSTLSAGPSILLLLTALLDRWLQVEHRTVLGGQPPWALHSVDHSPLWANRVNTGSATAALNVYSSSHLSEPTKS